MADDTMEICTVRYGDEDFDFDFDLSAPPDDEDSILEDANGIEHVIKVNSKISSANNDSMMNDNNEDSSFEMDDIEALIEDEKLGNEPDKMSLTTGIDLSFDKIQTNLLEPDDGQLSQESSNHNCHDSLQNQIDLNHEVKQDNWENEEPLAECKNNDSPKESVLSPQDNEAPNFTTPPKYLDNTIEVPGNLLSSVSEASKHSNQIDDSKRSDSSCSLSPTNAPEALLKPDADGDSSELNNVIISYQANEYALFSESELDDPDSFFIRDRTITHKPLSDFFRAIRDVIHEDLGDESELFISIPEFGLQTEETSLSIQDVTLSHLICLRRQLLLNDGIEIPQPLCIELGIRKSFLRGLLKINLCANEGKGLSDIAPRGDNCDTLRHSNVYKDSSRIISDQRFLREKHADGIESELNYTGLSTEYSGGVCSSDGEEVENTAEDTNHQTKDSEKRAAKGNLQSRRRESRSSRASYCLEPIEKFRSKSQTLLETLTEGGDAVSNDCPDEESDIIDYSEDDLEDKTGLPPQIESIENEYTSNPSWNRDKTIIKSNESCGNESIKSAEPNRSSEKVDCTSSTIEKRNNEINKNLNLVTENIITGNPIDTKNESPDDYDFNNEYQENDFDSYYKSLSDPSNQVVSSDRDGQVHNLENSIIELNAANDRNKPEDLKYSNKHQSDIQSDDLKEDILDREIEVFLTDDETCHSKFATDDKHTLEDMSTDRVSEIDRYSSISDESLSEKTLIETKQATDKSFSIDVPGAESEDEIDYEDEDEDEESTTSTEENAPQFEITQSDSNRMPTTSGKRSRIENSFQCLSDGRDIKRPRS